MPDSSLNIDTGTERPTWIRLRTIITLRWFAIFGQIVAITVAQRMYNLQIEVGLCYIAIGSAIIANLTAVFIFPENKRMSDTENAMMVLFDLLQLSFLLFLTGGLNNPFALLILAPITMSSTILSSRSTAVLSVVAVVMVTVLTTYYYPLRTSQGFILRIPNVFIFGNWVAIVIAIIFIAALSRRLINEMLNMADALKATHLALSREQKLTDIGGVVAAAAHELGTPLATIKLASAELLEELEDRPELAEDAALIREQATRCHEILKSMGRAGKDDLLLRRAPLSAVLSEAAEPHGNRGKVILFEITAAPRNPSEQPNILRRPEIIHGLRNLIQNAVDFSKTTVWVESTWTEDMVAVRIVDDGPGFPIHLLGRIGDPFMRRRKSAKDRKARPGYEGMGLGLFIAKTLLERSGAELSFANGHTSSTQTKHPKRGAVVEVVWPRSKIDALAEGNAIPIGENQANPTY